VDLSTVKTREKLKPQREPYWQRLSAGRFLGFRPSTVGKGGAWIARLYDADTRRQRLHSLGDFGQLPAAERHAAAKAEAERWFRHVDRGGSTEVLTVAEGCARYVEHLRRAKGEPAAAVAQQRLEALVLSDPLARVALPKLQERHVRDWRRRLEATPCRMPKRGPHCRSKAPQPAPRLRTPATVNRDMTHLRAALNHAKAEGLVTTDLAWARALLPNKGAERRREVYLSRDQRRALLEAIGCPYFRAFVRGLCELPLRPGALAALTVSDFDARAGTLTVGTDKAGAGRRLLLPESAAELLRAQAKGKLPLAPLFGRMDGKAWDKDAWKGPFKTAALAASLPPGAVAYALRHSAITDLCADGLDLMTVAKLAGTSIRMIEAHYGHLTAERARAALAGLAL